MERYAASCPDDSRVALIGVSVLLAWLLVVTGISASLWMLLVRLLSETDVLLGLIVTVWALLTSSKRGVVWTTYCSGPDPSAPVVWTRMFEICGSNWFWSCCSWDEETVAEVTPPPPPPPPVTEDGVGCWEMGGGS